MTSGKKGGNRTAKEKILGENKAGDDIDSKDSGEILL